MDQLKQTFFVPRTDQLKYTDADLQLHVEEAHMACLTHYEAQRSDMLKELYALRSAVDAAVKCLLPESLAVPSRMASLSSPWPEIAKAMMARSSPDAGEG